MSGSKIKFNVKYNDAKIKGIKKAAEDSLFLTAEALHTDVVQAQVMPFDTGTLQNTATSVQKIDDDHVSLQTVTDYAARLYYHPEFNFRKTSNPNAKGRWLEDWITGEKKDFCQEAFEKIFKKRGGF